MISGLESPFHLLIILTIALLVLGPKRLPEAGRALGGAIRNFRESISPSAEEDAPAGEAGIPPPAPHGPASGEDHPPAGEARRQRRGA
jgi:sec-independent protein translocase protein TatA